MVNATRWGPGSREGGGIVTPKLFAALLTIALTGGTALAFWMAGPGPLQTRDVWVSGTGDCGPHSPCTRTIGNAIEMVDASGTVHVLPFNGTYRENIGIPKPLTLRGEDRAGVVLLGIVNGTVIDIASSGVTVENMTVFHVPSAVDTTGVGMTKKGNVVLRALTLLGFGIGIRATDMRALTIEASDVVLSGGNGIVVDASRDIMIAPGNRLLNNSGLGLAVNASRNVTIASNTFIGNRAGFNVSFSVNVTVQGNTIPNNGAIIPVSPGPSPHPLCCDGGGGWFWQTDPTAVERNIITDNGDVGILIGGDRSTDFTLRDNLISGNRGHGVLLT